MSSAVSCERHRSLNLSKWGRTSWIILCFVVSGAFSLVTVHQPAVLSAALGQDIIMPCELWLQDEKLLSQPILYWWKLNEMAADFIRLIPSQTPNNSRATLLDNNGMSTNKSMILKSVQWADSGKYRCKLSLHTERNGNFRQKGDTTSLVVYGATVFNVTKHAPCMLGCEVSVTRDAGFSLHIFHNGRRLQNVTSAPGDADAALPYVTLSETVPLWSRGKYECQLHLRDDVITKSIFHSNLSEVGEGDKNESTTCSSVRHGVYPEPWFLYVALLLVPVTVLIGLLSAMLMCR
ncbi:uncharacterized protein LOC101483277 isoform X1 [Maylandia zebra]|uniref:uncharacterized protein LOC101483277 isoform X1 n=2 Tax=Maylandia zebra TaxID=106582 RepID=UPI00403C0C15